jgi:amino acid transporter
MKNENALSRQISKTNLLFISFTAIFGSGWLFAPHYAAQIAGPAALASWAFGAVMSAIIGIAMAEVVILFPKSGGMASISSMTHGKLLGSQINILTLIVCLLLPVLEVRAVIQYMSSYFRFLSGNINGLSTLGFLISILLLFFISWINLYGSKLMTQIARSSVILKLVAPFLICGTFLYALKTAGRLNHSHLFPFFSGSAGLHDIFLAMSTSGIIFSFNGFNQATLFAGEAKDPQRSIPFAIMGSLLLSGLLYLLVQYVYLLAVPDTVLSQGWKSLSFPGEEGPFAGIASLLGIAGMGLSALLLVIYADAIVSPLGTAFTYASAAPRMFYSFAESNKVFPIFTRLNQHGAPIYSVLFSTLLGVICFLALPSLKAMISVLVAGFVLCYTTAPASLLALRRSHPHLERKFKVPAAKGFSYLAIACSNFMVFCCGWSSLRNLSILITLSTLIGGVALYLSQKERRGEFIKQTRGCIWFLAQLYLLTLCTCLYENKVIGFEVASIIILGMSLGAMGLSQIFVLEPSND